jgi:GLPGLI family protein
MGFFVLVQFLYLRREKYRKMKKFIALLFVAMFGASVNAQEGHLVYNISISGDDPQVEMMKSFFTGAQMAIYFNQSFNRVDMNMGSMMQQKTIVDLKNNEMLTLMSGMMGKIATRSPLEEEKEVHPDSLDIEIELIDESKKIAGLNCKKAIVTIEDGVEMEMWYTNEIKIADSRGLMMMRKGMPGFPVQFSAAQGPMIMTFTLETFEQKLKDKKLFDMTIPEGYTEKSVDEIKSMGR